MLRSDLDEVIVIENDVYEAPWTRGNFEDSLAAGYSAWVARPAATTRGGAVQVIGYFVEMPAVDEAHLLNLTVARAFHRQGLGLRLLRHATMLARDHRARSLILEVRPSNRAAIVLYERYGFLNIGLRRGYYPASLVPPFAREDALVMRYVL